MVQHQDSTRSRVEDVTPDMMNTLGGATNSSYQDYPVNKPFINSEYRRDPTKPKTAYPETHRPGMWIILT